MVCNLKKSAKKITNQMLLGLILLGLGAAISVSVCSFAVSQKHVAEASRQLIVEKRKLKLALEEANIPKDQIQELMVVHQHLMTTQIIIRDWLFYVIMTMPGLILVTIGANIIVFAIFKNQPSSNINME